jgi:hypothetical protein
MNITVADAIGSLKPNTNCATNKGKIVAWDISEVKTGEIQPTEAEIDAELIRLQAAYPLQELREKRNALLAETDWVGLSDTALINEQAAEWKMYRQKLRDLPSGLDTVEKVNAVTWPEKPE